MACELWINQSLYDAIRNLRAGADIRVGQRITVSNKTICKVGFLLSRYGSPTGNIYVRIRKVSDDSIIETSSDVLDAATLTDSYVWYYFTFDSLINEEVRITLEYNGGDSSNTVRYQHLIDNVISGVWTYFPSSYMQWFDILSRDMTIKIYEEVVIVAEALPVKGVYGWDSSEEECIKIKVNSNGVLQTS